MIIYRNNGEGTLSEQAAKKEYKLRHNARVYREENAALEKLNREYEGKLSGRDKNWEDYLKKTDKVISETQGNKSDGLKAVRDITRDISGGIGYALSPRKVLKVSGSGEKIKVTEEKGPDLRERLKSVGSGFEDLRDRYKNYKEGHRLVRGAREAERLIPTPAPQSKEEKEYEEKYQKLLNKYKARYID